MNWFDFRTIFIPGIGYLITFPLTTLTELDLRGDVYTTTILGRVNVRALPVIPCLRERKTIRHRFPITFTEYDTFTSRFIRNPDKWCSSIRGILSNVNTQGFKSQFSLLPKSNLWKNWIILCLKEDRPFLDGTILAQTSIKSMKHLVLIIELVHALSNKLQKASFFIVYIF